MKVAYYSTPILQGLHKLFEVSMYSLYFLASLLGLLALALYPKNNDLVVASALCGVVALIVARILESRRDLCQYELKRRNNAYEPNNSHQ